MELWLMIGLLAIFYTMIEQGNASGNPTADRNYTTARYRVSGLSGYTTKTIAADYFYGLLPRSITTNIHLSDSVEHRDSRVINYFSDSSKQTYFRSLNTRYRKDAHQEISPGATISRSLFLTSVWLTEEVDLRLYSRKKSLLNSEFDDFMTRQ